MAILKIKKYPDPILRKKCQEVKEVTEEIKNLGWDMVETMTENQGIGLSAPQVGELKRIIVVHPMPSHAKRGEAGDETKFQRPEERTPEEKAIKSPQIFINPKITEKSKETEIDEEGCLSFPGLFLKIKRRKAVKIAALNERGEKIQVRAEGLPARIFQHEIDHLDGILFIDRLSFWQKFKLKP